MPPSTQLRQLEIINRLKKSSATYAQISKHLYNCAQLSDVEIKFSERTLQRDIKDIEIDESYPMPAKSEWNTLHFSLGKKDKINKIDVVGFLSQIANLKKDDIGLIEVKDFYGFVAVRKNKVSEVLRLIMDRKMKGKKVRFGVATNMVK